ncbi:MAG: hypothetical protein Q7S23_00960 [bacterium]|nr:hypothetical protein [bacterium]
MKLLRSKLGWALIGIYLAVIILVYAYLTINCGGGGFGYIGCGLTFYRASFPSGYFFNWLSAVLHERSVFFNIVSPFILNTVILYFIGSGIGKLTKQRKP